MPTGRNTKHYKWLSVHEQPLANQQRYLDALCFCILFPTGRYGEFHPRPVKLTFSEYIKSTEGLQTLIPGFAKTGIIQQKELHSEADC